MLSKSLESVAHACVQHHVAYLEHEASKHVGIDLAGEVDALAGLLLGLGIALNIDVIVPALESLLNASFLPRDIYLISRMPSDPQQGDIVPIAVISLVLAFLATLYPSWSASRLQPAEALRYE